MAYAGSVNLGEIVINYECEHCGKPDMYNQVIRGDYSNQRANYIGPGIAAENRVALIKNLEKQKNKIFETYDGIKVRKCPQCGHHQAWMKDSMVDKKIQLFTGVAVGIAFVISLIMILAPGFSWSTLLGGVVGLGFGGIIVWGILYMITISIVKSIRRKKKQTVNQIDLMKPPVLAWKAA